MRWFIILLIACVALSALKLVVVALSLVLVLSLLWGACRHPAETFGLLGFYLFAYVVMQHTLVAIGVGACLGALVILRQPTAARAELLLLDPLPRNQN